MRGVTDKGDETMNAELIHVGTELLLGNILNTNAMYLSQRLADFGINLFYQTVVGDNPNRIIESFKIAAKRSSLVIVTGGLGPTSDDLTKEALAEFLGKPLLQNDYILAKIQAMFEVRHKKMSKNNIKQSFVLPDAIILDNRLGTAPGMFVHHKETDFCLLPGPPQEMEDMFEQEVVPILQKKSGEILFSKSLKVFGIGESMAETLISDLMEHQKNPTIAPYANPYYMKFRVSAKAPSLEEAKKMILPLEKEIRKRLGDNIFAVDEEEMEDAIFALLKQKNLTLALAESITGGLMSAMLVNVPGSSDYFLGSVVSYSNEAKENLLSVPPAILETDGAVSLSCAKEMAKNAALKFGAHIGLSVTGVAGPAPSGSKVIGTVYAAIYVDEKIETFEFQLSGTRNGIRQKAALQTLDALRRYLS